MSRSYLTSQKQAEAKRSVRKLQAKHLYAVHATKSEDKAELRAIAERAFGEWQNKNHHRVSNLSDHIRRKY